MRLDRAFLVFISIAMICSSVCFGIKVSPAVFTVTNVPLGPDRLLGIELKIHNNSDDSMNYKIAVTQPAQNAALLEGYSSIPNTDFFIVEGDADFRLAPRSVESRKMFCNIPDSAIYYNQRWEISVAVSGGSGMLRTAVGTRYFIETMSLANEVTPFGDIATNPSSITLTPEKLDGEFILINSTDEALEFTLEPYIPENDPGKVVIDASDDWGFSTDLAGNLDIEPASIILEPGEHKTVVVQCSGKLDNKSEALVKISAEGIGKFVRVFFKSQE